MNATDEEMMDGDLCYEVREAMNRVTLGNCSYAIDDVRVLEHLAQRAVDAGLIDGLHPSIQKKILQSKGDEPRTDFPETPRKGQE